MRHAHPGSMLLLALLFSAAPCEPSVGPTGLAVARAGAAEAGPRKVRARSTQRRPSPAAAARPGHERMDKPEMSSGLGFVHIAAFSAPLHNGAYSRFPSIINPLVTQEFPATPEYNYLFTQSSVVGTPPVAMNYRYVADHRFLLRPVSGATFVADAYSWNRSFAYQITSRMNAQAAREANRPSVSRNPGQKIDNTLRPDGMNPDPRPSELNAALRNLRLSPTSGRLQ